MHPAVKATPSRKKNIRVVDPTAMGEVFFEVLMISFLFLWVGGINFGKVVCVD